MMTYPRTRSVLLAPTDSPYALSFGRPVQAKYHGKCAISGAKIYPYDRIRAIDGLGFALERSIEIMAYRSPTEIDVAQGADPRSLISPVEVVTPEGVTGLLERVRIGDKIEVMNKNGGGAVWERLDGGYRSARGKCSDRQLAAKLRRATFARVTGPLTPEEAATRRAILDAMLAEELAK